MWDLRIKCDIFNRYGSAKFEAANSERYHWLEDVRDAQGRRLGETGAPVERWRLVCCLRVTAPALGYDSRTLFVPKDAAKKFTPFEGQVRCLRCMPLTNSTGICFQSYSMLQFWSIKSQNYDVVLFFKKGKFYEL